MEIFLTDHFFSRLRLLAVARINPASLFHHFHVQADGGGSYAIGGARPTRGGHVKSSDPLRLLTDIREFDVPYVQRVSIDRGLHVGKWYRVTPSRAGATRVVADPDFLETPGLRVLAFDIECSKAPLKFPDATRDQIYMISYMLDGVGFLLINREIVSEDVPDFEYTPMPGKRGCALLFALWRILAPPRSAYC